MAFNPAKYLREVRVEMNKVTWPTRRETLISSGLVLALSTLAAIFFMIADSVIGWAVQKILGIGSM